MPFLNEEFIFKIEWKRLRIIIENNKPESDTYFRLQ